jgi:hypothetical protein
MNCFYQFIVFSFAFQRSIVAIDGYTLDAHRKLTSWPLKLENTPNNELAHWKFNLFSNIPENFNLKKENNKKINKW